MLSWLKMERKKASLECTAQHEQRSQCFYSLSGLRYIRWIVIWKEEREKRSLHAIRWFYIYRYRQPGIINPWDMCAGACCPDQALLWWWVFHSASIVPHLQGGPWPPGVAVPGQPHFTSRVPELLLFVGLTSTGLSSEYPQPPSPAIGRTWCHCWWWAFGPYGPLGSHPPPRKET